MLRLAISEQVGDVDQLAVAAMLIVTPGARAHPGHQRLRSWQYLTDKLVRDDGLPYYRVRIETDKDYFEKGQEQYRLFPGTQVLASIQTGHRTVIEYLLDPFLSSMGDALGER